MITTLHTPGHTPESTTYLLTDANGKDQCIFTGDLIYCDVIYDLAQQGELTMEDMAGTHYDSLHNKILTWQMMSFIQLMAQVLLVVKHE